LLLYDIEFYVYIFCIFPVIASLFLFIICAFIYKKYIFPVDETKEILKQLKKARIIKEKYDF